MAAREKRRDWSGADALELLEVLGSVALGAAVALAALEQAFALVVADGVDRDAGPLGQVVDAPVAHRAPLERPVARVGAEKGRRMS